MFELPQTKRIRRSELRSPSSSPSPEEINENDAAEAQNRLAQLLSSYIEFEQPPLPISTAIPASTAINSTSLSSATITPGEDGPAATDFEFTFPLFSHQPAVISLAPRPPSPPPPPTQFELYLAAYNEAVLNQKPRPHLWTPLPPEEVAAAAVSGEEIQRDAERLRWLGLTFPWKLIELPLKPTAVSGVVGRGTGTCRRVRKGNAQGKTRAKQEGRKCKPGKKRRIFMRVKIAKEKEEMEKKKAVEERRERENAEKRMLRNKEKKAKKRAREKMKKMTAREEGIGEGGGEVEVKERKRESVSEDVVMKDV